MITHLCASFKFGTERNLCNDTWLIPSPCNHVITIPIDIPQKEFLTNGLGSMLQRVNIIHVTREPRVKNNLPWNKLNVHFHSYFQNCILLPSSDIFQISDMPPTFMIPKTKTAHRLPNVTIIWTVSAHTTAFKPP